LTVAICRLRKVLRTEHGDHEYIQTVATRGYRFVGEVRFVEAPELAKSERPAEAAIASTVQPQTSSQRVSLSAIWKIAVVLMALTSASLAGAHFVKSRRATGEPATIHSLAVLPFQPLNADAEQKSIGSGLADAITTRLWRTGQIIVRPTVSVLQYERPTVDPLTVGRKLKVDAILDGNIELSSSQVRVNLQMVRVRDGFLLWAGVFQSSPQQIFSLEEEIAEKVVQAGPFRLSGESKMRLARQDTENSKAYALYMEGRNYFNQRTEGTVKRSIGYFQQAIEQDPQYAQAYASLADAYVVLGSYGEPPWQVYPPAKDAALKAVNLDDSLASAHASLAMIAFHYEWNWSRAAQQFQRAIALNPEDPMVHIWYGMYLAAVGRIQEAVDEANRGTQLDSVSSAVNTGAARVLYWSRAYDRAIRCYRKVINGNPKFQAAYTRLAMAYLAKSAPGKAISELKAARQLAGHDPYLDGLLGYGQAHLGNTAAARKMLDDLTLQSRTQYVPAFSIALVYIGLGDRNHAVEWLERAYQDHSTFMVYVKTDPLLDSVRSNPQFTALLRQMALSETASPSNATLVQNSPD
ncbi:MAG: TPR end-of-group domain-containing protein, partial [Terriglobia bacterium]